MGTYRVILPFTRKGETYKFGDTIELPDAEPQEFRDVGMLLNYGIISTPEKPDTKQE